MSSTAGPSIQTNGLVFDYDMSNTQKSFKGPPATNLIPYSQDYGSNGNFMANWTGNLFSNWINSVVTTGYQAPDDSYTANLITGYYSRWTASITASVSTTYTFSIWLKNYSLTSSIYLHVAFGLNGSLVNYNNVDTFQPATIENWTRCSWTVTSPSSGINQIQCGVEFGGSKSASAGPYAVLVWGAQLETGSYPTPYIPSLGASSSRSSTQAILDLTNNNTITATSLTYAANSTFSFVRANSNYINISANTNTRFQNPYQTWSGWVNIVSTGPNGYSELWNNGGNTGMTIQWRAGAIVFFIYNGAYLDYPVSVTNALNTWMNITCVIDNIARVMILYKNGALVGTSPQWSPYVPPNGGVHIGGNFATGNGGDFTQGNISNVQLYNRALSATEIQQNFNALRTRYGI